MGMKKETEIKYWEEQKKGRKLGLLFFLYLIGTKLLIDGSSEVSSEEVKILENEQSKDAILSESLGIFKEGPASYVLAFAEVPKNTLNGGKGEFIKEGIPHEIPQGKGRVNTENYVFEENGQTKEVKDFQFSDNENMGVISKSVEKNTQDEMIENPYIYKSKKQKDIEKKKEEERVSYRNLHGFHNESQPDLHKNIMYGNNHIHRIGSITWGKSRATVQRRGEKNESEETKSKPGAVSGREAAEVLGGVMSMKEILQRAKQSHERLNGSRFAETRAIGATKRPVVESRGSRQLPKRRVVRQCEPYYEPGQDGIYMTLEVQKENNIQKRGADYDASDNSTETKPKESCEVASDMEEVVSGLLQSSEQMRKNLGVCRPVVPTNFVNPPIDNATSEIMKGIINCVQDRLADGLSCAGCITLHTDLQSFLGWMLKGVPGMTCCPSSKNTPTLKNSFLFGQQIGFGGVTCGGCEPTRSPSAPKPPAQGVTKKTISKILKMSLSSMLGNGT